MNASDLLHLTSKADLAVACMGFAAGFTVDVFLFPAGVPPGTTASVFAVGSIGLKNLVSSFLDRGRADRRKRDLAQQLLRKAHRLADILSRESAGKARSAAEEKLARDKGLWELGLLTDQELEESIRAATRALVVIDPGQSSVSLARFHGLGSEE